MLLGLSLAGAVAELATLGAVIPFIGFLSDPTSAVESPLVATALGLLGWSEGDSAIVPMTIIFFAVVVVAAGIRLGLAWASVHFAREVGYELGAKIYEQMLYQPYLFHVSKNTSEIIASVSKVDGVIRGVLTPALDMTVATILSTFILGGLFAIEFKLTGLAAGLFGLIYVAVGGLSRSMLARNAKIIGQSQTLRVKYMQEGLGGIRDILLDGSQLVHKARFANAHLAYNRAISQNNLWSQTPRYVVEALGIGVIAGLAVLIAQRDGGLATALPALAALALGAQRLLPLFQRIYAAWSTIKGNRGNIDDVAVLLDTALPEEIAAQGDPLLFPFTKNISLRELGFRYASDLPFVLRSIDLQISKGQRIGIVGETGCGKSTLLDLVMGLLTPSTGKILVDGKPLDAAALPHWQARIAHVPQTIFLTDASIESNIAFAEPPERIDRERVVEAARRARIHDFIQGLPEQYSTEVGERGVRISGGQRQRIGIARALYRKADVLILDEATSALDSSTEESVMEGIDALGANITVFMVAHRLSTLRNCDLMVHMLPGGLASVEQTNSNQTAQF
ncbi:MAG: ATP-binding cassette domain-containing protein [Rhodothermales bacterium]|nr:ATP-binding cassette domain-containing protein [Rhodothermales bacterium]MBO6781022.1 ATP-binding cassette domain-containing protein [Rhodothermales bacterium]